MVKRLKKIFNNFRRVIRLFLKKSKLKEAYELEQEEKFNKAIKHYNKLKEEEEDLYLKSYVLTRKALCLIELNELNNALQTLKKSNRIILDSKDNEVLIANNYLLMGELLRKGEKNTAINYYKKALKHSEEEEIKAEAHLGIGIIKKEREKYKESESEIKKSLEFFEAQSDKKGKRKSLEKMKELYKELGNEKELNQISKKLEEL